MELVEKPVISCAGHESLVSELETRCLSAISSEPAWWKYSKRGIAHSVHIEAYFTRFQPNQISSPVKILSSGRPIRPVGSLQPLLYIYVISNNLTQYVNGDGRNKIRAWLGYLHERNINEWIILMINADQQSNTPKIWQRPTVLQKIKEDFYVPSNGEHFLQVADRRAVEEKVFQESWTALMRSVRNIILDAYRATIVDYENHLQLLQSDVYSPAWNFFEYFDRKEELAQMYTVLEGYEDALGQYEELESLFSSVACNSDAQDSNLPQWMQKICSNSATSADRTSCTFLSCFPLICSASKCAQSQRIKDRSASLFDIRTYILSRQLELLCLLDRLYEFPERAHSCISGILQEIKALKVPLDPILESCWTFLVALNALDLMRQKTTGKSEGVFNSVISTLSAAFSLSPVVDDGVDVNQMASAKEDLSADSKDYLPSDNILLRAEDNQDNPVAYPLAVLADAVYTTIMNAPKPSSSFMQPMGNLGDDVQLATSFAVELWLVAFTRLGRLGQMLSLWSADKKTFRSPAIDVLKGAIDDCANAEQTNETDFNQSIHKYMAELLSSGRSYKEIFVAIGQTLIGFFKLLNRPRRAVEVACSLSDFLHTIHSDQHASCLYSFALSVHLRDNWSALSTHTYYRLASCLRSLIGRLKSSRKTKEIAMIRYFHCCLALSSLSPTPHLDMVIRSLVRKPTSCDSTTSIHALPDVASSPDFWWSEAIHTQKAFSDTFIWDALSSNCSPFRLSGIELIGASPKGYQLISVTVEVTTQFYFGVSIKVPATQPTLKEWKEVMHYTEGCDCNSELGRILFGGSSKTEAHSLPLVTVDLRRDISRNVEAPTTHTDRLNLSSIRLDSISPQNSVESVNQGLSEGMLFPPPSSRRKSSLLDIAASLANRPAWKSQDQLDSRGIDSRTTERVVLLSGRKNATTPQGDERHQTALTVEQSQWSTSSEPGLPSESRMNPNHPKHPLLPSRGSQPNLVAENLDDHFLKIHQQRSLSDSDIFFTPVTADGQTRSMLILQPGMNTIQLAVNAPGFYLASDVTISVIKRAKFEEALSSPGTDKVGVLFNLNYTVLRDHFRSSWQDPKLLDSLLPKVSAPGSEDGMNPIRAIIGLRQPIPMEFVLGKLGIPKNPGARVGLYRLFCLSPQAQTGTHLEHTRNPKAINDYSVTILGHTNGTMEVTAEMSKKSTTQTSSSLDLQDGMIPVCNKPAALSNSVEPPAENGHLGTRMQLERPVWITAITEKDEFFISMPSGYLCRLPVKVIKPLGITLNVYTLQAADSVIFAFRVSCMDIPESSKSSYPPSMKPTKPLSFRLSKFQMMVAVSEARLDAVHESRPSQAPAHPPHRSSVSEHRKVELSDIRPSLSESKDALDECADESQKEVDYMLGAPVDVRCTEAVVSRLCPVTLLWQLKFSDFRPFVTSILERFNEPPVARLKCNYCRLDDPNCESQLIFQRRISGHPLQKPSIFQRITHPPSS
ncbi:unnamed protein product [Calicophoron daubneyi]|uniref:TRAPPC10/Trs130 N-terminal domain-containing protein n=1 Tax=Calicophoron daubneyi TaxID=300641 RepID=A0AAV2SWZ4_CALDB